MPMSAPVGFLAEAKFRCVKGDTPLGFLSPYTIGQGLYFKQGEDRKSEFYLPSGGADGGRVERSALADPFKIVQAYKDKPKLCGVSVFNATACEDNAAFERRKVVVATADAFQQTLIYSGKSGDTIHLSYREFSNNLARPAFNNDVSYDLSESNIVGYKGAEIEVLEATNTQIRYKVIRNFNAAVY